MHITGCSLTMGILLALLPSTVPASPKIDRATATISARILPSTRIRVSAADTPTQGAHIKLRVTRNKQNVYEIQTDFSSMQGQAVLSYPSETKMIIPLTRKNSDFPTPIFINFN